MTCNSKDVARFNYAAVCSLMKGDYQRFLAISHQAMVHIQRILRRPHIEQTVESSTDASRIRIISAALPDLKLSAGLVTHGAFELYQRALIVQGNNNDCWDNDDLEQNITLSAVVLYNTALCHHIRGLQNGASQDFVKANQMYKMAARHIFANNGTNHSNIF
jgi:hypothetical protein